MDVLNDSGCSFRLRRWERLRRKREFEAVFRNGSGFFSCGIKLRFLSNGLGWSRLGLAVGRKAGKAVSRNRVRRLLREGFRFSKHHFPYSVDIVAIPVYSSSISLEDSKRAFQKLACNLSKRRPTVTKGKSRKADIQEGK